jgi:4-oxalmesaconate hydratase
VIAEARRSRRANRTRGIDPQTGHHFDDTRRYVDAVDLSPVARDKVYELNARRVYPRLDVAVRCTAPNGR